MGKLSSFLLLHFPFFRFLNYLLAILLIGKKLLVYVRFWLSRAIEGFLRGRVSPVDQHFLISRDLIEVGYKILCLLFIPAMTDGHLYVKNLLVLQLLDKSVFAAEVKLPRLQRM